MKTLLRMIAIVILIIAAGCSGPTHWAGLGSSQVVNVYQINTMTGNIGTDSWADERGFGQGADLHWKTRGEQNTEYIEDDVYEETDEVEDITEDVESEEAEITSAEDRNFLIRALHEEQWSAIQPLSAIDIASVDHR